jgi:hypothetical protein
MPVLVSAGDEEATGLADIEARVKDRGCSCSSVRNLLTDREIENENDDEHDLGTHCTGNS